jgi:hypothetical protein
LGAGYGVSASLADGYGEHHSDRNVMETDMYPDTLTGDRSDHVLLENVHPAAWKIRSLRTDTTSWFWVVVTGAS